MLDTYGRNDEGVEMFEDKLTVAMYSFGFQTETLLEFVRCRRLGRAELLCQVWTLLRPACWDHLADRAGDRASTTLANRGPSVWAAGLSGSSNVSFLQLVV